MCERGRAVHEARGVVGAATATRERMWCFLANGLIIGATGYRVYKNTVQRTAKKCPVSQQRAAPQIPKLATACRLRYTLEIYIGACPVAQPALAARICQSDIAMPDRFDNLPAARLHPRPS